MLGYADGVGGGWVSSLGLEIVYIWQLYSRQMRKSQVPPWQPEMLALSVERRGPLPLINHFLERLALEAHLERFVPTPRRRTRLPYTKGLGILLRSLLVEREPLYRQYEMVSTFSPQAFGLEGALVDAVSDDAVGRALDHLFDADRAALLTEVLVSAVPGFDLKLDELHNDSTTVRFCGQYTQARARKLRGKRAPLSPMATRKTIAPTSNSCSLSSPPVRTAASPCNFAASTAIPTTRVPMSTPGRRCVARPAAWTSSMSLTPSSVIVGRWTTSTTVAVVSFASCRARVGKTASSESGFRPTNPPGHRCGTGPTRADAADRAIAGGCFAIPCLQARDSRSSGSTARCWRFAKSAPGASGSRRRTRRCKR